MVEMAKWANNNQKQRPEPFLAKRDSSRDAPWEWLKFKWLRLECGGQCHHFAMKNSIESQMSFSKMLLTEMLLLQVIASSYWMFLLRSLLCQSNISFYSEALTLSVCWSLKDTEILSALSTEPTQTAKSRIFRPPLSRPLSVNEDTTLRRSILDGPSTKPS